MKKSFFLFIILSILINISYCFSQSQEATIYFKDGESIQGYASIKNDKIKFRVTLDSKADTWTSLMIDRVEFDTFFGPKIYKYIKLEKISSPILLELVTEGELSLYRKNDSSWTLDPNFPKNKFPSNFKTESTINYLIHKDDNFATCLNCGIINNWKKRTLKFLKDCPELVKKIKKNEFREIHMEEIITYYNDFCSEL